jgi:diguanylate cyclase (GGDEF)-like protein
VLLRSIAKKDKPEPESWRALCKGLAVAALLVAARSAAAFAAADAALLLETADRIKSEDPAQFAALLSSLEQRAAQMPASSQEYLHYLEGWKLAYDGEYPHAITSLEQLIASTRDRRLAFRARVTIANTINVTNQYGRAFAELGPMLEELPQITDSDARAQAQIVAAQLYNSVAQYDLALSYASAVAAEHPVGKWLCKAQHVRMRALVEGGRITAIDPEVSAAVDDCVKVGELGYANFIRTYAAKLYIGRGEYHEAIQLLKEHYEEMLRSRYRRLVSQYDGLLAVAYQKAGSRALARAFALSTVEVARKDEYREPLVSAYRVLYELARNHGDYKAALAYQEKYAEADKGFLDEVSTRQLAYQKFNHESIAKQQQLEATSRQSHLAAQLAQKEVEASRLQITLLTVIVAFLSVIVALVAWWAYRTKRKQLHFKMLSQIDHMTEICNRQYFMEQAEGQLECSQRNGQDACLVLWDVDHFKSINDRYGHAIGDSVLKRMAAACKAHLRRSDVFARFGGEEFAILLPGCPVEEARKNIEALRVGLSEIVALENGQISRTVSASFGIAATSFSGYDLGQLLVHADKALYHAKRTGRNRTVVYDGTAGVGAQDVEPPPYSSAVTPPELIL